MSLGCPSVARWWSHRRLRNGLCPPSISPRRTSSLRTIEGSRPTFRSLRSAATDGHPRFSQAHASHSQRRRLEVDNHSLHQRSRPQARPLEPRKRPQARPIKSRRTKSVQIGSDRHEPSMSLGCPSVARRRSRRRLRNGLCEPSIGPRRTSSLRTIEGSRPAFRSLRCAATDGHPRFSQARASHSQRRRLEVDNHSLHQREPPQRRPPKPRRPAAKPTEAAERVA
jgi:hypothetical protein